MKYTESHEWITVENTIATIGITNYAQSELGDIVYVELPEIGQQVTAGEEAVVLESTKAAADVYSPLTGKVIAVNEILENSSEIVNEAPETEGWLFKLEIENEDELQALMDKAAYEAMIK